MAAVQSNYRYALSIQMKYGEVLHVDKATQEEKDKYVELSKQRGSSMIIEDRRSVRHLHSDDIAKISIKRYEVDAEQWKLPFKKMFFTESTLGRGTFTLCIKTFVLLAFLALGAGVVANLLSGDMMEVVFSHDLDLNVGFSKGFQWVGLLFGLFFGIMVTLNVVDCILGLNEKYFINQEGELPAETTRLSNVFITLGFLVGYLVVMTVLRRLL